jgi:hypothetical protein
VPKIVADCFRFIIGSGNGEPALAQSFSPMGLAVKLRYDEKWGDS